jgi:hypothetical protein
MSKKKKQAFNNGDIFLVPLKNGEQVIGQVLDMQMINVVRCAFFAEKYTSDDIISLNVGSNKNLISLVAITKEQLEFGVWKVIGNKNVGIPLDQYPNEQFRSNGWIGAKIYDAAILEDFLNAFYRLMPWDDWADPYYLDKLLVDKSKKPDNLLLVK